MPVSHPPRPCVLCGAEVRDVLELNATTVAVDAEPVEDDVDVAGAVAAFLYAVLAVRHLPDGRERWLVASRPPASYRSRPRHELHVCATVPNAWTAAAAEVALGAPA